MESGLGERVEPISEALPEVAAQLQPAPPVAPVAGSRLVAVAASPGIAIGPALVRTPPEFHFDEQGQGLSLIHISCCCNWKNCTPNMA